MMSGAASAGGGGEGGVKGPPARQKRRSWLFQVDGATNTGVTGAEILALVRHKYSTLRRLIIRPASSATSADAPAGRDAHAATSAVLFEVHFTGPQPSATCGAMLCSLLGGESVEAWPIELPRGRKIKEVAPEEDVEDDNAGPESIESMLASPQRPRKYCCKDVRPLLQQQYRQQQQQHRQQRQQQQQQPLGAHNAVPVENGPFHAVQPQEFDSRPPGFGHDGSRAGGYGEINTAVPPDAGGFACSPRRGASSTFFGGRGRGALLPMEEVRVGPSRRECNLEGRSLPRAHSSGGGAPMTADSVDDGECFLVFIGLERTGHDLGSLNVTALFGVDRMNQIATVTSPLQVGADGRVYAHLYYPSLKDIRPDLYYTPNVQVIQVDVEVEILSDGGGEYRLRGPHLKLAYYRTDPRINAAVEAAPGSSTSLYPARSRSGAEPRPFQDEGRHHS